MDHQSKPKPKKRNVLEDLYYERRSKWIEAAFARLEITHADFRVLYFLAKRSGYKDKGCYWSVPRIAEECQCSTKTVSDATGRAAELGLLRVVVNPGRKNFYAPIFFWL